MIFFFFATGVCYVSGQAPIVSFLSKDNATVNEIITLSGSSFNPNVGGTKVFFGGIEAEVIYNSANLIEIRVPPGVAYDYIRVLNTETGQYGYSPSPFKVSFGGDEFDPDLVSFQNNFAGSGKLYDLCACDFNVDGRMDVAASDNSENSSSVFINNSLIGNPNFTRNLVNLNNRTISTTCGDLNSDGLPDLLYVRSSDDGSPGNIFYILRNTSSGGTVSFQVQTPVQVQNAQFRKVRIYDLDSDGKQDLIFSNQITNNSEVIVLKNNSSGGNISFESPIRLPLKGIQSTGPLLIRDFNDDGFMDIATAPYLFRDILIYENTSSVGQISFSEPTVIPVDNTIVNLTSGDFNNDGLEDIACTRLTAPQGQEASILINTSKGSAVSFESSQSFRTNRLPWGIDAGDLDGDGMIDLLIGSIDASHDMTVLINKTAEGSNDVDFESYLIPTTDKSRNVKIFDVDDDGRPDMNFISVTDLPSQPNSLGVILNQNCLIPKIFPEGEVTICEGLPFQLTATEGEGLSYRWEIDLDRNGTFDTVAKESNEPFIDVNTSGFYKVYAISNGGECEESSELFSQVIIQGDIPSTPGITQPAPVCIGDTMFIVADEIPGTDVRYAWKGPANFRDTLFDNTLVIPNFTAVNSGQYTMEVIVGDCQSQPTPVRAESINLPKISIRNTGDRVVCSGTSVFLSVGSFPNFDYNWRRNDTLLNQNTTLLEVNQTGTYEAIIENTTGCFDVSEPYNFEAIKPLNPVISNLDTFCVGQNVTFFDNSELIEGLPVNKTWQVFDRQFFGDSLSIAFNTSGLQTVTLTIDYIDLANCSNSATGSIFIKELPEFSIQAPQGNIFCEGDSILLSIDPDLSSILWSNGIRRPEIKVGEEGVYGVQARNDIGCLLQAETNASFHPSFNVSAVASPQIIEFRESSNLITTGGGIEFTWNPGEFLNDSTLQNPIASPFNTTVFQVLAIDENGCLDSAFVTVEVAEGLNVIPQKLHSSSLSDYWQIQNIDEYPDCKVTIFDRRGAVVYGPKIYEDDFNGGTLDPGDYYYVIQCENQQKTGSLLLVR